MAPRSRTRRWRRSSNSGGASGRAISCGTTTSRPSEFAQRAGRRQPRSAPGLATVTLCWLPVQPGMEWARANSRYLWATGPWVWCCLCGAHTKTRKRNLHYQGGRWKLQQLAAGQDPNSLQPLSTHDVRRLRTAEVEEWELQLD